MTRDANQIAQEHARRSRNWREDLQPPRLEGAKPNRGEFSVWKDGDPVEKRSSHFRDVTVQINPGVIVLGSEEGSTYLLYPEPGWYCEFIPDADEGE